MTNQPERHRSDASDQYLDYFDKDIDYQRREPPPPYSIEHVGRMVFEVRRGAKRFARIQASEEVANRLVDCLNACRGVPSDAFGDGGFWPLINACKSAVRVFSEVLVEKYKRVGQTRGIASMNDVVVLKELQERTFQIVGGTDGATKPDIDDRLS